MAHPPSLVCPIDFSDASRGALRYAAAIADHFGARLTILTVDDPLLASVATDAGREPSLVEETRQELRRFVAESLPDRSSAAGTMELRVAVGKPAGEILRVARERETDLIVMSSQGRSGVSKRFFGSTTERVLRETTVPVLVTPKDGGDVRSLADISRRVRRIVAPVDLTAASAHQVMVAAGLAGGLSVPLILAHVLEPVFVPPAVRLAVPGSDAERRAEAEAQLLDLAGAALAAPAVETLVVSGDPSEEIVKLAETRGAGLVVIGLHSSGLLGPRMGSVTYRVLCLAHALVIALPPVTAASSHRDAEYGRSIQAAAR